MAKNDNLKDFLTDIADAIREKKGTTDAINPQDFSSEIASIQSGGVDFSGLGYDDDMISQLQSDINYSMERKKLFEEGVISDFKGDNNLVFAPFVDVSNRTSLENFYNNSHGVKYIPKLDMTNNTSLAYAFRYTSISICGDLNIEKVLSLREAFSYNLALIEVGNLNSKACEIFRSIFYSDGYLTKIKLIDFSSATEFTTPFFGCGALRYLKATNLGKSTLTTYDFSGATSWGAGSEENRQSLIDSLITYSHDRASNGMSTATIKLSANTKALLTEEEIAQITNKGFTIS